MGPRRRVGLTLILPARSCCQDGDEDYNGEGLLLAWECQYRRSRSSDVLTAVLALSESAAVIGHNPDIRVMVVLLAIVTLIH